MHTVAIALTHLPRACPRPTADASPLPPLAEAELYERLEGSGTPAVAEQYKWKGCTPAGRAERDKQLHVDSRIEGCKLCLERPDSDLAALDAEGGGCQVNAASPPAGEGGGCLLLGAVRPLAG